MRDGRQWVSGQTGEPGVCRIPPIPLRRHRSFLSIPDKSVEDEEGIGNEWESSVSIWRAARRLFVPLERMVGKRLHHRLGWKLGAPDEKDLELHLVSGSLTAHRSDYTKPPLRGCCWRRTFVLPDGLHGLQPRSSVSDGTGKRANPRGGPVCTTLKRVHLYRRTVVACCHCHDAITRLWKMTVPLLACKPAEHSHKGANPLRFLTWHNVTSVYLQPN